MQDLVQAAPTTPEALTASLQKFKAQFPSALQVSLNAPQKNTILKHLAGYFRAKGIPIDQKLTVHQPILCFGLHLSADDAEARFADFRSTGVLELPNRPKIVFWDEMAYAPAVPMDPFAAGEYAQREGLGNFSATFSRDLLTSSVQPADIAIVDAIHRRQMQRATTPEITQKLIDGKITSSFEGAGDEFFDFQTAQIGELVKLARAGFRVEYRVEEATSRGYLRCLRASAAAIYSWQLMTQGRSEEALEWYAQNQIINEQTLVERDIALAKMVAESWKGNKSAQHLIIRGVDHDETFPTYLRSEGVDCRVYSLATDDVTRLVAKDKIPFPGGEYDLKQFVRANRILLAKVFMAHLIKHDYVSEVSHRPGILGALRHIKDLSDAKVESWLRGIATTPPRFPKELGVSTLRLFSDF